MAEMRGTWFKFVLWTTIIGAIARFVITFITGEPFFGILPTLLGGIHYLFFMIEIIIGGIVVGSIIFGTWYIVVGRKMVKTWLKFVVWTMVIMVIGTIICFIITTISGEPFFNKPPTLSGGIFYLLFIYAMIISGILLGSIIFGTWYIVVGRKKKKVSSSAPK